MCKLYLSKALPPNHTSRGSKRGTGGHKVGGGCGRSYVPGPISWEMAKTSLGVEWGENWDVLPMVKENLVELVSELRAPWLQPSCPTSTAAPPLTGDGDLPKRNALQKHVSKKTCRVFSSEAFMKENEFYFMMTKMSSNNCGYLCQYTRFILF